nr:uncharacterized protein LOC103427155 [Malus domestica]
MTNISRSPFTDKIEQTDPPCGFTMPHFTLYKGDEDLDQHLKHYCSTMIHYRNNNAVLCKFFATIYKARCKTGFTHCRHKEYLFNRSIKRTSDHLFSIVKGHWETVRDYIKRFKAEKAKIVGYIEDIELTTFKNELLTEHLLFKKLIMG